MELTVIQMLEITDIQSEIWNSIDQEDAFHHKFKKNVTKKSSLVLMKCCLKGLKLSVINFFTLSTKD